MLSCEQSSAFDLTDACVRNSWSAILPAAVVCALCVSSLPVPSQLQRLVNTLKAPFSPLLTLQEAEALTAEEPTDASQVSDVEPRPSLAFTFIGLVQSLAWITGAIFYYVATDASDATALTQSLLIAFSWLYTTIRPIASPFATVPYDLFTIYLLHFAGGTLILGGYLFDYAVGEAPWPGTAIVVALSANIAAVLVLLYYTVNMPMNVPSMRVKKEDIGKTVCPEDYTRFWGWLSFSWVFPLIQRGTRGTLDEKDVWNLSPTMQARAVYTKFKTLNFDFLGGLLAMVLQYSAPFFLKRILDTIDQPNLTPRDKGMAYAYAGLMFLCAILKAQCDLTHLWFARRATTQVRSELMSAIYEKALKRKDFSGLVKEKEGSAPDAVDKKAREKKADDAKAGAGWAGVQFAGFAFFFAIWPINSYLTSRDFKIKKEKAKVKDTRMAVLDELISSIKFIKFFAWEDRWVDRAMAARKAELGWMVKEYINNIIFSGLWSFAPISLSVVSFFIYIWLGNELTAGTAFTAIALFSMIRFALYRIANYLEEDEVTPQVSTLKQDLAAPPPADDVDEGLGIENASFEFPRTPESAASSVADVSTVVDEVQTQDHRFELRDISVIFPEGRLSVITGPTASGKTALLMALMGEMTILPAAGGRIIMAKSNKIDKYGNTHGIAYAAQTPWLRHQSIRDNILFGSPFDEARYNQVVECCALKPDFDVLEDGDATEIGSKGVSLSGGQRSRVALARAVYSRKKYLLLDDPLSAVDSHTSRFLFEKCLQGPLLAQRTVILVTHHVELVLPGAHYVVRMLDGRIDTQGTVEELRAQGVLDEIAHEAAVEVQKEELAVAAEGAADAEAGGEQAEAKKPRRLVEDEHRETGSVKWVTYREYLRASGYYIWGLLSLLVVLQQLRTVSEKIWIKVWSGAYETSFRFLFRSFSANDMFVLDTLPSQVEFHSSRFPNANERPMFYVGVYAAIMCSGVVLQLVSAILQYVGALRASRNLFRRLLVTVVRATFRFHDTTPQGRMLNRFSKDFATVDSRLAGSLQVVNTSLAGFFASILTVTAVFPAFLLPATFVAYNYWRLAVGYLNTGRDLRRMESNTRSPIFSDFGELLTGVVTVRAFSAEKRFMDAIYKRIDAMTAFNYFIWMTNRWLLLNYDVLGEFIFVVDTGLVLMI
ncbi:hypothetical protein FB45DRAFT_931097, partial [Roridomyces roridus]